MDSQKIRRSLLSPFYLWFFFFIVGPLCLLLLTSFSTRTPLGGVEYSLSLDAYKSLAQPVYLKVLANTLFFALGNTFLTVVVAFPLALLMTRVSEGIKALLMALILIPFWTSYLVRVLAFMSLLRQGSVGDFSLLYQPAGVLLGLVYNYLPFAILPLYSSLERIEKRSLEAAQDLGATKSQILWRLIIPMAKGGIVSACIFVFVPSLGEYLIPELVGGGRSYLVGSFLQNQFMSARNWPLGSAAIIVLVLVTFITVTWIPEDNKSQVAAKGL
jgi:spermidine/putrescine transport system permease protein